MTHVFITYKTKMSVLATLFLLLLPLCAIAEPKTDEGFTTTKVEADVWQRTETAFANVKARQQAVIGLPFSARITALMAEPGARVNKDDILANFDAPQLRQHLALWHQKRIEFSLAKKRLNVLRQSEKSHTVTRREVTLGEIAVAQAEGEARMSWETLASDLDLLNIAANAKDLEQKIEKAGVGSLMAELGQLRAPFSGLVTKRWSAIGEQLAANKPILELEALDRVYVDVGVTEDQLAFWKTGETSWKTDHQSGALTALDGLPLYDQDSGLWQIRFEAENPELSLRDDAWIETQHKGEPQSVYWVPASAIVARKGKTWCIVQTKDGKAGAVAVRVGSADIKSRIPVLSGLKEGDMVVTKGAYELLYRDINELIRFVD